MARTKGTILVIDPNVEDYKLLGQIFSSSDYQIIWAGNGNDGIHVAETEDPDLILIDLRLPDIKGIDVCRNLRLRNSTWSIPIILVATEDAEEGEIVRGLELGANDSVCKPLKTTELMGRVGVLMRMKRVEDKIRRLYLERTRELEWSNIELQKARTQLILKNQMSTLGMMVAVVAHEIKSPAASISGNLEMMSTLLREFILGLAQLPLILSEAGPEATHLYHQLLAIITDVNLLNPPLDMLERRKATKSLLARLRDRQDLDLDEQTVAQLVKFRMEDHLEELASLSMRYGPRALSPIFALGELLVKFRNMNISIARINGIVRAMKAYTHIDRSELQALNVHDGLDDTLTIMNYIFRGNVDVVKHYADELPTIPGYPGELNQVWTNLLQNAYDAMEGQKRQINVETQTAIVESRAYVLVRIIDSGKGISKEFLPHIFDSFFTTKETGKGSGLGLDICKRIVEKHQGFIEVNSIPGCTAFSIHLPVEHKQPTLLDTQDKNGAPRNPLTSVSVSTAR